MRRSEELCGDQKNTQMRWFQLRGTKDINAFAEFVYSFVIEGGNGEQNMRQCCPRHVCQRLLHALVTQIYKKSYLLPRMLKNVKCSYWLAGQSWSVEPLWHRRRNVEILNSFQISFRYLCVHLPVVFAWLDIIIFVHSHKTPRKIWYILFLIPGCRCHELELEKEMWSLN